MSYFALIRANWAKLGGFRESALLQQRTWFLCTTAVSCSQKRPVPRLMECLPLKRENENIEAATRGVNLVQTKEILG